MPQGMPRAAARRVMSHAMRHTVMRAALRRPRWGGLGLFRRRALFALAVLLPLAAALGPAARADHGPGAKLHIEPEGWGRTRIDELRLALDAVVASFGRHFDDPRPPAIRVVAGGPGPIVFYDKSAAGEYVVRLSARDGRWHQFVYQFAHELCHIYSNFDNKIARGGEVARGHQWFEESVCEAAALATLRELAVAWRRAPPAAGFVGQGESLDALADYLLAETHRQRPGSITAWFRAHEVALSASPYLRDKNEVVSNLLLPLFEQHPGGWRAIAYLNSDAEVAGLPFADYLEAWRRACPEAQRRLVQQIIALFRPSRPG
jgi:hypothetical protein